MKPIIDREELERLGESLHEQYVNADPFPHIVIDDFFPAEVLDDVLAVFPGPADMEFYKYDNPLEKKLAMDQLERLPDPIVRVLQFFNSVPMLKFAEKLTGIPCIIPDPYYRGGGIHQMETGGKLDVHIDFNLHGELNLDRRLNAIIYLNKDWEAEYGGDLELWSGHREDGKHVLDERLQKIAPLFNRLVVFDTDERSYHGLPEPMRCPDDRTRRSMAVYYYTNGRPEGEKVDAHSTTFIARPEEADDEELNALREKRNKGRLSSNVK